MDQIQAMRVFLAVADRSGFAEAARALRLSPAAVTRAVAGLEAELGLALFSRTTRSVRLTERGAIYADRCRRILSEIEDATSAVRGEDAAPRGRLSVTAPVLFGRLHVLPAIERLMAAHPALSVRLALLDRVTHMVEEGFDVAVRIGTLADSALIAVPVTTVRRVLVAAPAYLAEAGVPHAPADLKRHRIIGFEGVGSTNDWRFGPDGRQTVTVAPALSVNSADAAIASAERGHGLTRALSYQVEDSVAAGRLTRLLTELEPPPIPVSLVYQAARRGNPNIAALVAEMRGAFR
jgi:DNA-binding transcriptional LysR family regulator